MKSKFIITALAALSLFVGAQSASAADASIAISNSGQLPKTAAACADPSNPINEWHFVLTQLPTDHGSPTTIQATFQTSAGPITVTVPRTTDNQNQAGYTWISNLNDTLTVGTAVMPSGYDGNFNLSHWPCYVGGHLIVHKVTQPAGDATSFSVTLNGTPVSGTATRSITGATTADYLVTPGTYSVSEASTTGWEQSSNTCTNVTITGGETKDCTITNQKWGRWDVFKHVTNDNGGTATAGQFSFTVVVDGDTAHPVGPITFDQLVNPLEGSKLIPVAPGHRYKVIEVTYPGYTSTIANAQDQECNLVIQPGQIAACNIYNNDTQPKLIVKKHVVSDNGGTLNAGNFTMNVDGTSVSNPSFSGSEDGVTVGLNVGSFNVTENDLAGTGYAQTGIEGCSGTIALGETKTCTITNDDIQPKITLVKHVINDNGGHLLVSDFPLSVGNTSVTSGVQTGINAGTYSVSEQNKFGYAASDWSGDCAANGSITLNLGDVKTCEITNNDIPPVLVVIKSVVNTHGGSLGSSAFTMNVSGANVSNASFAGANGTGTAVTLDAGTYGVTESSAHGYVQTSAVGCNGTIAIGQTKICNLVNNDLPAKITLVKTVNNNYGGDKQVSDFPLNVSGTSVTSGQSQNFNAGAYVAGETQLSGYTASAWGGDCAVDGSITVDIGDEKTCTITNSDIQPKLIVKKVVVNDNGGTLDASAFTMNVTGTDVTNTSFVGSTTGVTVGLDAGSFSVTEGSTTGYAQTNAVGCSSTIAIGETKTCTITNDDIQPKLIVKKIVINDDGNDAVPGDFRLFITGSNPSPSSASGTPTGVEIAINAGSYNVTEGAHAGYKDSYSVDCSGSIAVGETKECVVTNNDLPSPTRTQGFWQTHTTYTTSVFNSIAGGLKIGNKTITTPAQLFAGFYSSLSKKSDGKTARSALDQAKMQVLQQWLAASLNCAKFGCTTATKTLLANASTAWAGTNTTLIKSYVGLLDAYNNSNDGMAVSGQGKATPKDSQNTATTGVSYWDNI